VPKARRFVAKAIIKSNRISSWDAIVVLAKVLFINIGLPKKVSSLPKKVDSLP
jgi:hypothetical protein